MVVRIDYDNKEQRYFGFPTADRLDFCQGGQEAKGTLLVRHSSTASHHVVQAFQLSRVLHLEVNWS